MLRGKFAYNRSHLIWILLLLVLIDIGTLALLLSMGPGHALFQIGFGSFITAIAVLVGVSPFLTSHEVHDTYFIISQGWYYRNRVDMSDIVSMKLVRQGPPALGIHFLGNGGIYVNGTTKDLIMLEVQPSRSRNGKRRRMTRILFDVVDPNGFMKALGREFDGTIDSLE